ncbi:MerR family transcriptional regulator [Coralliovum pocilloporae]|uniref:MerR family transcriptional regulator n=1 Tax=Coralliovum pocilloporae TaxID=3066369 RepID=UPI00330740E4
MYTIKTLSNLTGVNPDTIRSWERRYDLLRPERTDSGRRTYSDGDVEKLTLIAALLKSGHTISHLAALSPDELNALRASNPVSATQDLRQKILTELEETVGRSDLQAFGKLISSAITLLPPHDLADRILSPILRTIGDRWSIDALDIGDEHAFTAVIKQCLMSVLPSPSWTNPGPVALFTTLADDHHELGALMACHIAANSGFNCHYLGPNMPGDALLTHCQRIKAELLVVSLITSSDPAAVTGTLNSLAKKLQPVTQVWVGFGKHAPFKDADFDSRIVTFNRFDPFHKRLVLLR